MVGVRGLEPRTSALSVLRSNQLSYTPIKRKCASMSNVEHLQTNTLLVMLQWSRRWDSNPQQSAWKAETLAIELRLRILLRESSGILSKHSSLSKDFLFFFWIHSFIGFYSCRIWARDSPFFLKTYKIRSFPPRVYESSPSYTSPHFFKIFARFFPSSSEGIL